MRVKKPDMTGETTVLSECEHYKLIAVYQLLDYFIADMELKYVSEISFRKS